MCTLMCLLLGAFNIFSLLSIGIKIEKKTKKQKKLEGCGMIPSALVGTSIQSDSRGKEELCQVLFNSED